MFTEGVTGIASEHLYVGGDASVDAMMSTRSGAELKSKKLGYRGQLLALLERGFVCVVDTFEISSETLTWTHVKSSKVSDICFSSVQV